MVDTSNVQPVGLRRFELKASEPATVSRRPSTPISARTASRSPGAVSADDGLTDATSSAGTAMLKAAEQLLTTEQHPPLGSQRATCMHRHARTNARHRFAGITDGGRAVAAAVATAVAAGKRHLRTCQTRKNGLLP